MRLAPALVLVALSSRAGADAPTKGPLVADIDGDGTQDRLELTAKGELTITTRHGTVHLTPAVVGPMLSTAIVRGTPTIVVHGTVEAVVYQLAGTTWKPVTRTPIGAGPDDEYSVAVAALPEGLFSYEERPGFGRCDNRPPLLFGKYFDGQKFRTVSRLPTGIADAAPVLQARRDDRTDVAAPLLFKARVASHQVGSPDARMLAIPSELDDGTPATSWREELAASAGEGQFFTYRARVAGAKATQVRLVTGAMKNANRPQRLGIVTRKRAWHVDLPPSVAKDPPGSAYVVDVPEPMEECVTIVLESTEGPAKGTTEIAELQVLTESELNGGGEAALARVVADGAEGMNAAIGALSKRGAAASAAIDGELGRVKDAASRRRLVQAAVAVTDPSIGPVLSRIAKQGDAHGADLLAVIRALTKLGLDQDLHDLAARPGIPLEARVAAAKGLQRPGDKAPDLLLDLAGDGPRPLRQAVIESLAEVEAPALVAAATSATKPATAGDLWRAATRRARLVVREQPSTLAAMLAALPTATEYELRYRLVDGIATLGDAAALKSLARWLAALPADSATAAYKQVAARSIASTMRVDAVELLIALTSDRDAGVRLAALSAIAGASGTPTGAWHGNAGADGIDRVIITRLTTDTWPEVRRSAAQTLGVRCDRPGPAKALFDAVARDPDLGVRTDAIAGLVECKAPGTAALLAKLWDDSEAPLELRRRAVDLTCHLGDRALAAKLTRKLTQWRGGAIESEAALALAQNAAYALGCTGGPGAVEALMAALDDSAYPEIVAAGAAGLGLLGPACPPAAKKKLEGLRDSDEQQVQIAARRAASVCGKR